MSNKVCLSASALKCFKACTLRYLGQYELGIRKIVDSDALRIGTHWHEILEIADDMDKVVELLNERYSTVPDYLDKETLEIERIKLLYSLTGYNWYYQNTVEKVLATEVEFEMTVINPDTGRAMPGVKIKGKIDKFVETPAGIFITEHKSTSDPVDPDSRLWKKLQLDTQTNMYVYVARRLCTEGKLVKYGIKPGDNIAGVYYDVWHKPTISPKKLTQGDSKKFVETGEYCDQTFTVDPGDLLDGLKITINGVVIDMEPGAKEGTFAIRETPEMYGARLLKDIVDRPEFYFNRKELTKTEPQIKRFEIELYNIWQNIKTLRKSNGWYGDESQCEATFTCDFIGNCYNNIPISLETMPEGMECIYNK